MLVLFVGLSHEQNLQKMRLLTFMQMAESRKEIPFDAIQMDLQLNPDQVESFVIDGKNRLLLIIIYMSKNANILSVIFLSQSSSSNEAGEG